MKAVRFPNGNGSWSEEAANCSNHFKITGSIDLPELRPWDAALGRPQQSLLFDSPTQEQLATPGDLFTMIWRVKQALFNAGLKARTIEHYIAEGMSIIFRRHLVHGLTCYSAEVTDEVVAETRTKYEQRLISRSSYQNIRKAGFLLATVYETGNITLEKYQTGVNVSQIRNLRCCCCIFAIMQYTAAFLQGLQLIQLVALYAYSCLSWRILVGTLLIVLL